MKLSELCNLISGFQGKTVQGNQYSQIKLKDVTKDGKIKYDQLEKFNCDKVNDKYLLKKGDIILKAKSGDNTAALVDTDIKNIVPASHFIIISVNDTKVITPEYLVAYLNSEYAQDYFKVNAEGTALPIIKIKTLGDLEIKVVELEKQKEIADMYKLMKDEKELMEQIMENREKQFTSYLREKLN
ncbi:TaqI-like C-terminal specificity domain-containing protein [Clostridium butyricum]|uniref:TaqI-like C-terminal specificity domain-containing protein n=1 Tax=Clostridium butyricum TaxID=1492 RepID=UPI003D350D09